jgi:hypothetical protein
MSPEDNQLLNFIATTVETLSARLDEVGEQVVTKVDLTNLREQMQNDLATLREELRAEMATKDDLSLMATTVRGDFDQVHLRSAGKGDDHEIRSGRNGHSRIRSVLYLLVKDKPDMLRLLGQPMPGEARPPA